MPDLCLRDLVEHRQAVDAKFSIETVDEFFCHHPHEYAAVTVADRVVGICSRAKVRGLLGGRYGFSLHHRASIRSHLLAAYIAVDVDTALHDVLTLALSRGD